jgi:hypothetical protein
VFSLCSIFSAVEKHVLRPAHMTGTLSIVDRSLFFDALNLCGFGPSAVRHLGRLCDLWGTQVIVEDASHHRYFSPLCLLLHEFLSHFSISNVARHQHQDLLDILHHPGKGLPPRNHLHPTMMAASPTAASTHPGERAPPNTYSPVGNSGVGEWLRAVLTGRGAQVSKVPAAFAVPLFTALYAGDVIAARQAIAAVTSFEVLTGLPWLFVQLHIAIELLGTPQPPQQHTLAPISPAATSIADGVCFCFLFCFVFCSPVGACFGVAW